MDTTDPRTQKATPDGYAPRYPRLSPPFKMHWNWEIMLTCNYRCSYCGVHDERAPYLKLGLAEWKSIWDSVFDKYGCCQIRFSGGEPTIYPGFAELVAMLLKKHTVDITTNLSFDVEDWMSRVPAAGIAISGSLHPEHVAPAEFLKKLLLLRKREGQLVSACFVAYPPHLGIMEQTRLMFEENGILFKIIPFSGPHEGKRYPEAYTEKEKELLGMQVERSGDGLGKALNRQWQDFANAARDDKDIKDLRGVPCHMGEMYAKIFPDGTVRRCCHPDVAVLGRITDPDLRLFDGARPCEAGRCACWKAMAAGRYEQKAGTLWQSPRHPVYPDRTPGA